jgi:hypothetical protein
MVWPFPNSFGIPIDVGGQKSLKIKSTLRAGTKSAERLKHIKIHYSQPQFYLNKRASATLV